jgi:hypothetical protein
MKREIVDVIEQKRLNEAREQKDSLLALLRESRMHFFNCAKLRSRNSSITGLGRWHGHCGMILQGQTFAARRGGKHV